jgi:hypothetical protein
MDTVCLKREDAAAPPLFSIIWNPFPYINIITQKECSVNRF